MAKIEASERAVERSETAKPRAAPPTDVGDVLERGHIEAATVPGGCDLRLTLESGQSYHWKREGGTMYSEAPPGWYATVVDGECIRVRECENGLEWESTTDAVPILRRLLRLDDDLPAVFSAIDDPLVQEAYRAHRGMRLVRDPPFVCLISFICSTQMRVPRIHGMVSRLAASLGQTVHGPNGAYHAFPTPATLAATSEERLRDLGLGYRAPYVKATAQMVADGTADPAAVRGEPYEAARSDLTEFVGVGSKVADCVLLFSLGYLEAVPLDTWITSAIETYYPECNRGTYEDTSAAIREQFGGAHAGYAQTYVFHHLRTGAGSLDPATADAGGP